MSVTSSTLQPRSATGDRTTPGQDLVTVLLASWMTLGAFVDGFAHRNLDTPETFFTPWHAVLYSGFLAATGWLVWLVISNRPRAGSLTEAIPVGYGTALTGAIVFMAGGVGDMFWHILFGIEVSIDALLSPTHLMLLVGALLMLSGPLRSAWLRDDRRTDLGRVLTPVLAVTMGAAQLGFFFQYMDGTSARFMEFRYLPGVEEGYFAVVAGVGSIMLTTIIVIGSLLLLMRRWALPPGAGLVLFGVFGLLMETLEGFDFALDLIPPLAGGLVVELFGPVLRRDEGMSVAPIRMLAFLTPVVMWSVHFALFATHSEINWPVSVWAGLILFTGLAGTGLSLLVFPPTVVPLRRGGSPDLGTQTPRRLNVKG